jgi:hypothetical protein
VRADGERLVLDTGGAQRELRPVDEHAFLVDRDDPDRPTITFDDGADVLYDMVWGMPRASSSQSTLT